MNAEDDAFHLVRGFFAIDGPNHGIIDCSPSGELLPTAANGGFVPRQRRLRRIGLRPYPAAHSAERRLRDARADEVSRHPQRLWGQPRMRRFTLSVGAGRAVARCSRQGSRWHPHDFSTSALLAGALPLDLVGEGRFDAILQTAHLGVLNSPTTRQAALMFLRALGDDRDDDGR